MSKRVLLNDTFQTKVANLSSIAELGRQCIESYNLPECEVLSIDIDDPCYFKAEKINYSPLANYTFNSTNPDPSQQIQEIPVKYKVIKEINKNELPEYLTKEGGKYPNGIPVGEIVDDSNVTDLYSTSFDYTKIIENSPSTKDSFEPINTTWNRNTTYNKLSESNNIGITPDQFSTLQNSIFISKDNSNAANNYIYYDLKLTGQLYKKIALTTSQQKEQDGTCIFKVAFPTATIKRKENYHFSNLIVDSPIDYNFYKNLTDKTNVRSFISWLASAKVENDKLSTYRFCLNFRQIYLNNKYIVQISDSNKNEFESGTIGAVEIPNYDGNSFIFIKCEYHIDDTASEELPSKLRGFLYYQFEESEEWIYLTKISPNTSYTDSANNITEFGIYRAGVNGSMVINSINIKFNEENAYKLYYNDTIYNKDEMSTFIDDCIAKYSYDIKTYNNNTPVEVKWFNNTSSSYRGLSILKMDKTLLGNNYSTKYNYFAKRFKEIKVITEKNSINDYIKSLSLKNKSIYRINVSDLSSLKNLDLENNKLTNINLLNNTKLCTIKLKNNPDLKNIIFPKCWDSTNTSIIIEINSPIDRLELLDDILDDNLFFNISNISNVSNIKTLILKNINIDNVNNFISNRIFTNVQYIDISNSNILANKDTLETFINKLPDRSEKEFGIIYLYGKKYESVGIQGSLKAIAQSLLNLKNKNWLFYV